MVIVIFRCFDLEMVPRVVLRFRTRYPESFSLVEILLDRYL